MRWLRRIGKKLALWVGLPLLLLFGGFLYGLRYGFRPLPQAPPGFRLPYPPPDSVPWDQAPGGWAAIRDLDWIAPALTSTEGSLWRDLPRGRPALLFLTEDKGPDSSGYTPVTVNHFSQFCDLVTTNAPRPAALAQVTDWLRRTEAFATVLRLPDGVKCSQYQEILNRIEAFQTWAFALGGRAWEQDRPEAVWDYATTLLTLEAATRLLIGDSHASMQAARLGQWACLSAAPLAPAPGRRILAALDRAARLLPSGGSDLRV